MGEIPPLQANSWIPRPSLGMTECCCTGEALRSNYAGFFTIHSCAGSFLNTQRRFGPAITFR